MLRAHSVSWVISTWGLLTRRGAWAARTGHRGPTLPAEAVTASGCPDRDAAVPRAVLPWEEGPGRYPEAADRAADQCDRAPE
ncbi:hypothetical protein GCM10023235_62330 [Kitasatospora terrestris]|uniref:Secreted protein n=1 Tax=Kitasatospora terrestris TaxID=258051 RepID=A0ABP9EDD2_9ACTN